MAKNYLNKLLIVFLLCLFCIVNPVFADDSLSQLFVKITDATVAVQKGDQNKANQLVGEIKKEFENNKSWSHFDAVKNNKVIDLDSSMFGMTATYDYQKGLESLYSIFYSN